MLEPSAINRKTNCFNKKLFTNKQKPDIICHQLDGVMKLSDVSDTKT